MDTLYKIESYSDEAVNTIAEFIRSKGGRCCIAGYAVITNHPFRESEAWRFVSGKRSVAFTASGRKSHGQFK